MASHPHPLGAQNGTVVVQLPWLTVAEIARTLALCPRTVRRLIRSGQIAAVATSTMRGRLRVSHAALAEFLQRAAVRTSTAAGKEGVQ